MKRMALMLSVSILMLSAVPAFSQPNQAQKDECLLTAKNCTSQVDDIYKRMHKLDKEIKKGTKVYTPEELNKLQAKLKEAQDILKDLEREGGQTIQH
jgi:flagellar hook-associated protein FlgK